ncbi:NAD(P)-dependent oxidoreductase [Peribacillus simplex]
MFETEPLPENSPLWGLNNVIITPHTYGILRPKA